MQTSSIFRSALLLASALLLGGCATFDVEKWYSPYETGTLQGEGVRIEAEDGSFTIAEGKFTPPFQTRHTQQTTPISYIGSNWPVSSLLNSYNFALNNGARRVKVFHPASETPLYGVLLLNQRFTALTTTGPAARSYLVRIPDSYVKSAQGGSVSVVYEPVTFPRDQKHDLIGWALWLSDSPL